MGQEFKVDKLGWYKKRNGELTEIISLNKLGGQNEFGAHWFKNGNYFYQSDSESEYDLIEYIGPELQKEPRKFEFEAYIGEYKINGNNNLDIGSAIDKAFGHPCGGKLRTNKGSYETFFKYVSKWKVTMEELPNEN